MSTYFERNRPRTWQFGPTVNGAAVRSAPVVTLHTFEAGWSAAQGASYLTTRGDSGSYHWLTGLDQSIHLAPWRMATAHAIPANTFAKGVSAMWFAGRWGQLSAANRTKLINGMALGAHRYSRWCVSQGLGPVQPRRLTRAQAMNRMSGFVYHGTLQPESRSDPGADFPWTQFINEFRRLERGGNLPPAVTTPPKEKTLSLTQANIDAIAQRVMTTPIRSGFSGNNVMVQTSLRQTQEALTNGRVFRNTIPSGISENNVMVQTAIRQTQQRADKAARETGEIKAMVTSGITELAEQLDSLKPGLAAAVKEAVAEAAEKVRREQVEISAQEVAEELEITARAAQEDEAQDEEEES